MSEGSEYAVIAEDLSRTFGDFTAVDRVSFEVKRGEVFGFLGPNGAGKTTTIKMLTGLLRPSSGRGAVAGYDIYTGTENIKKHIGYMSQLFSLYNDLTVDENITFFAGLYNVQGRRKEERRDWALYNARLVDQHSRITGELPLGFKQRLALGCAVLHDPPVLFLDEPTSGVDPISRRNFWELIYRLTEGGTTVFVTTHYMEEAEYCTRLALMNRGRLIALGTPDRLRNGMTAPLFELQTGDSLKTVKLLQRTEGIVEVAMFGRAIHVTARSEDEARSMIPKILESHEIPLFSIDRVEPSLEDVFVSLVQEEGGAPLD